MMSEVAFFVKDVIGPKGWVSIVKDAHESRAAASADIDSHTKTNSLRLHHSELNASGAFVAADELISTTDEPGHQALCDREQAFLLRAIQRGSRPLGASRRRRQQPARRPRPPTRACVPDRSWRCKQPLQTSGSLVCGLQSVISSPESPMPRLSRRRVLAAGLATLSSAATSCGARRSASLPAAASPPSAPLWHMPSESVNTARICLGGRRADGRSRDAAAEADRRRLRAQGWTGIPWDEAELRSAWIVTRRGSQSST